MSIFKKTLALLLVIALTAAIAVSGTLAYLQDEKSDVNVMTLGSVKIEQHEYQRQQNADGTYVKGTDEYAGSYLLEGFKQNKPLLPIVGDPSESAGSDYAYAGWDNTVVNMTQVDSYGTMQVFAGKNAQDKFVTVENTGKSAAYIRTLVAIEIGSTDGSLIGSSYHTNWTKNEIGVITVDKNNYYVTEYVYKGADGVRHENGILPAGDTSYPSLSQVYLKSAATNEDMEMIDGNGNGMLDILVLSQAVQVEGFADAQTALDTAFGKTAEKAATWFGGIPAPIIVSSATELQNALDNATNGTEIILSADITGDVTATQKPDTKITINGAGNDFSGVLLVDGKSATITTAGVTIKNVNFVAESISADACIRLGDGTNTTRYTCNVTVENCTFDVPGAVGVKSYTGGDKNLKIINCTATARAHSLVQAKGIDGILVENCTVNSKNGMNFNNSDNVTVIGCTANTKGYCVRFGESKGGVGAAETYRIEDCTLTSACEAADDAVIVLRGTADYATLTIVNTTITGTRGITNDAKDATVIEL